MILTSKTEHKGLKYQLLLVTGIQFFLNKQNNFLFRNRGEQWKATGIINNNKITISKS